MSRLVPDLGREKSSRLSTMRRQRCTSLSMILRYSSCAWRSLGVSSSARSASASQQARMVASGLLISCMTPAASCPTAARDRKSTRLNSSHGYISYAVFCLKKKTHNHAALEKIEEHPADEKSTRGVHPPLPAPALLSESVAFEDHPRVPHHEIILLYNVSTV